MRTIGLLFLLLAIGTIAFSQEITVRFTGQLNNSEYCRLDSVKVTNLTRNWTETVEYPDTIIVLGGTVDANMNIAPTQGLGQNVPNPFNCETRVEFSVAQHENVCMQLLDASGKQYADYRGSLDAGVHTFDISAVAPQTYILNAVVGDKTYSIRMVNMGSGCGSSIKYAGISGSITAKLTSTNEFQNGDNMRYVGYTTINDDIVASTAVEQAQTESEDITLNFAHCINTFGTDIQSACDSYTWIDGVTYTESTNEPTFTLTNAAGCDSIVTLQLTITHSNMGIEEQIACDSYEWIDGNTYTESTNEPTFTLTNNEGCDSVVTLHLTIACPPIVQTNAATDITSTSATLMGYITSDGGVDVTDCGFLYGTSENDLTDTVHCNSVVGSFAESLTDLTPSTTYYYKAYANNSAGIAYGIIMSFTTDNSSIFTDTRDGNRYSIVTIGNQTWMAENLRYAGSIPLSSVASSTIAYRYWPANDSTVVPYYGYLYNWPAAMNGATSSNENPSGVQGICPNGWHLPSDAEWTQLSDYLGGVSNAGAMLAGYPSGWVDGMLTNSEYFGTTGFGALAASNCGPCGNGNNVCFGFLGSCTYFWSSTVYDDNDAYYRGIQYGYTFLANGNSSKNNGFSIRCVRDN